MVAQGQITIAEKNQGERLKLGAASFDVGNAVGDTTIYGQRLCGTLTVRNDGDKPFCGNLMMHLHKEPGGVGILSAPTPYTSTSKWPPETPAWHHSTTPTSNTEAFTTYR